MIPLPFGSNKNTPTAERVKQRAKEVGSGIPDILVPSAYRETEPSEGLRAQTQKIADALEAGRRRQHVDDADGSGAASNGEGEAGTVDRAQAEQIARKDDRVLLELQI